MNLTCYVIDDEDHAIDVLVRHINRTPGLELLATDKNPLNAIKRIGDGELRPDLIFADIEMPDMTGIELADVVGSRSLVIFTTAFSNFAVNAFDKNALDYMLKPITYDRFIKAVDKGRKRLSGNNGTGINHELPYFFIKADTKGKLVKVFIDDIVYVEGKQNYIQIIQEKASYFTYLSMTEIEEKLPRNKFMRCNRSYIANLDKVKIVEGGMISFIDGKQIILGTSYKEKFMKAIEQTLIKSKRN